MCQIVQRNSGEDCCNLGLVAGPHVASPSVGPTKNLTLLPTVSPTRTTSLTTSPIVSPTIRPYPVHRPTNSNSNNCQRYDWKKRCIKVFGCSKLFTDPLCIKLVADYNRSIFKWHNLLYLIVLSKIVAFLSVVFFQLPVSSLNCCHYYLLTPFVKIENFRFIFPFDILFPSIIVDVVREVFRVHVSLWVIRSLPFILPFYHVGIVQYYVFVIILTFSYMYEFFHLCRNDFTETIGSYVNTYSFHF